jgi:hypothetical protein
MRLFYIKYPIFQTVFGKSPIRQTLSGKLVKSQTVSGIPDQKVLEKKVKEIIDSE